MSALTNIGIKRSGLLNTSNKGIKIRSGFMVTPATLP